MRSDARGSALLTDCEEPWAGILPPYNHILYFASGKNGGSFKAGIFAVGKGNDENIES